MLKKMLTERAAQMGLTVSDEAAEKTRAYHELLTAANRVMNLTRVPDDESEAVDRNYLDSLTALVPPSPIARARTLLDVGSGAGLPGVPLSILLPDTRVTLLDSQKKRVDFLRGVIDALDLNAVAAHGRAEDAARERTKREAFDAVVARAVARLAELCELTLPFCRVGGFVALYKGPSLDEEIEEARRAIHLLGGRIAEARRAALPGRDWDHRLLFIEKIAPTPSAYPRKAGEPGRKPL